MADTDRIKRNIGKMIDAGAPRADIDAYLSSEGFKSADDFRAGKRAAPQVQEQGRSDAAANAFGQGATLGFGDELAAGVRSAMPEFSNWMMQRPFDGKLTAGPVTNIFTTPDDPQRGISGIKGGETLYTPPQPSSAQTVSTAPTYDQRYDEELARQRAQTKADAKAYPVMTTGANLAGTLATAGALSMLPGGQTLLGGGATSLPGAMLRGAASGATLGGVQGFGEGEGGFDQRLKAAGTGAAVGGVVGGALPAVGTGARYAYEKWAPPILNKIADIGERFVPKGAAMPLSAAAPEGGSVAQDSWITSMVDTARNSGAKTVDDAALRRLAPKIVDGGGVNRARSRLAELGDDAFIADTSKGAERLAELGAMRKGEAPDKYAAAYTARRERAGERFLGSMGQHADAPGVSRFDKFFEGYKSGKGAEIYDPVLRSGKFNVSEEMAAIAERPAIKEALETVAGWEAKFGKKFTQAERFHLVKRALNANTEAAFGTGKPVNKNMIGDTASEWEQALWAANPAIKEADTAYAKVASLPEWRDRGLNFMKRGYGDDAVASSADALADELPRATAQQQAAAAVGASNVMADAARGGARSTLRLSDALAGNNSLLKSKLTEIYGPEFADQIIRQSKAELAFQAGNQNVNGGSPTGRRLASLMEEAALTAPPTSGGDIAALLGWVKDTYGKASQPSEAVRSRLADLLANPDPRVNAETLSLVEAILRQQSVAHPVSAGISGAAGDSAASPR